MVNSLCMCAFVCVCERERTREKVELSLQKNQAINEAKLQIVMIC